MSEKEALRAISDKKWATLVKIKGEKGFEPKGVKMTLVPNEDKPVSVNKRVIRVLFNEIEPVDKGCDFKSLKKATLECEDLLNQIRGCIFGVNTMLDELADPKEERELYLHHN